MDASEEELLAAVKALHEGLLAGAPPLMQPLLGQALNISSEHDLLVDDLTPRENEVLHLLSQGLANKQIARKLGISQKTVEKHRAKAMDKMEADSLATLVKRVLSTRKSDPSDTDPLPTARPEP